MMKVKDLLDCLQSYDGDVDVKFAIGPVGELDVLYTYPSDDGKTLWFDVGDESEAAAQASMLERYETFGLDPVKVD